MTETIEAVLDEHVRPFLHAHGGDIQVLEAAHGVVRFRFLGQCSGCPAADLTAEELVQTELTERVPGILKAVLVQDTSEDLLAQARDILRRHQKG